jgi:hypothetical protein
VLVLSNRNAHPLVPPAFVTETLGRFLTVTGDRDNPSDQLFFEMGIIESPHFNFQYLQHVLGLDLVLPR